MGTEMFSKQVWAQRCTVITNVRLFMNMGTEMFSNNKCKTLHEYGHRDVQ